MLSICIPVYNFHVEETVRALVAQIKNLDAPVEVRLLDDGSKPEFKELNQPLGNSEYVVYEEMPHNVGRSEIRNELARRAKFDHILFLDCDSKIINTDFLKTYIGYCKGDIVIYGGRKYGPQPTDHSYILQWAYSVEKNGAPSEERTKRPYHSFCTNNFLITKQILLDIPFNNSLLSGWGHEDTLFAYTLGEQNYPILHIDNPIEHGGYISNEHFINQMNQGLVNLYRIYSAKDYDSLVSDFKTTRYLKKLEQLKMVGLIAFGYRVLESFIIRNITGKNPSLRLFDIYKLGYLCNVVAKVRRKREI